MAEKYERQAKSELGNAITSSVKLTALALVICAFPFYINNIIRYIFRWVKAY